MVVRNNYYKTIRLRLSMLLGITTVLGMVLASSRVMAEDTSVVDQINITVPVSCTISGTGMTSHNADDILFVVKVEHFVQLTRDEMVMEGTS